MPEPDDRPEIEVTPEMIEAGADIIRSRDLDFYRATEIAEEVFKTMLSCKSHGAAGGKDGANPKTARNPKG